MSFAEVSVSPLSSSYQSCSVNFEGCCESLSAENKQAKKCAFLTPNDTMHPRQYS